MRSAQNRLSELEAQQIREVTHLVDRRHTGYGLDAVAADDEQVEHSFGGGVLEHDLVGVEVGDPL